MIYQEFKNNVNSAIAAACINLLMQGQQRETEFRNIANFYIAGEASPILASFSLIELRLSQLQEFSVVINFDDLFAVSFTDLSVIEIYTLVKKTATQIDFKITAELQTQGHIPSTLEISKEEFDLYQSTIDDQYKIVYNGTVGVWEDSKHVRFGESVIQISDFKIRAIKAGVSL